MTAPHDTPEAVETALFNWRGMLPYDAEAMLRRLHKRAVDAERERDQWIANSRENKMIAESNLRERDEARADALREAVNIADAVCQRASHLLTRAIEDCHTSEIHHLEGRWHAANDIGEDIAILAAKPTTGET